VGAPAGQYQRDLISMTKFKWRTGFAAAVLMAAQPAFAAGAAVWTVDPAKSKLGFSGSQTGQPFSGNFARFNAAIALTPPTSTRRTLR
jgi:polyisoprenoid-binding protein YceI